MVTKKIESYDVDLYFEEYPYVNRAMRVALNLVIVQEKNIFHLPSKYEELLKSFFAEFMMEIKINEGWMLYDFESLDHMVEHFYLGSLDYLLPSYEFVKEFMVREGYFFTEGEGYYNSPVRNIW